MTTNCIRLRGEGHGDKTPLSSGTLKSRVGKSHPGQKDKCLSDVTGVVTGDRSGLRGSEGPAPSTWTKLPLSTSPGTVTVRVPEIPTICHTAGIQDPQTD